MRSGFFAKGLSITEATGIDKKKDRFPNRTSLPNHLFSRHPQARLNTSRNGAISLSFAVIFCNLKNSIALYEDQTGKGSLHGKGGLRSRQHR